MGILGLLLLSWIGFSVPFTRIPAAGYRPFARPPSFYTPLPPRASKNRPPPAFFLGPQVSYTRFEGVAKGATGERMDLMEPLKAHGAATDLKREILPFRENTCPHSNHPSNSNLLDFPRLAPPLLHRLGWPCYSIALQCIMEISE
jgi:hypothetical protein